MKLIKYSELTEDFYKYQEFEGIESVSSIISDVKNRGDVAIKEYSKKFGDGDLFQLEISSEEIEKAYEETSDKIKDSLKQAIENVRNFAKAQLSIIKDIETNANGIKLGHKVIPLERIGAYVPGGNYPLPSSVIMSVIPAKVAGVKEIIVCSPKIQPATITACKLAGTDRIFRIGGVQAIAGMAYGTETIPQVDKIVGPGNKYVTAAKKEVYGVCGIDFLAGPSEVMIIADETAISSFIAVDMLAQCEHDPDARAYLITTSDKFAHDVIDKVNEFLENLETKEIASISISKSTIILVENIEQAVKIANEKAPEHLEICYKNAEKDTDKYINYGSLFIGNYSAEVFGDYCSGTNHILPTNGVARYTGGLSVLDFIKVQTYQQISKEAAQNSLCGIASNLANIEGLMAHKLSANLRKSLC
ncbi:MAG: histidinol dehydrogenase [Candidatus Melainabacteria bacterium GWA2_34_9]|nr:MAG: histidinol dehydrogenase [Candidatus Melainabacteria bacterium GWA2_34_9]